MKKKLISLVTTSCLCLSLISSFFVFPNENISKNIHKKVQKVKIVSQEKKIKSKTFTLKNNGKKTFSYTSNSNTFGELHFSFEKNELGENIDQYFYGKNFYFMLFGVIKNIN